jgi:hypothetical protein
LTLPSIEHGRRAGEPSKESLDGLAMPPLPGVQATFKGVPLGVSGPDGSLLATYVVPPDPLSLVAPGWHVSALRRMPGAGSRWWVWMRRDP